MRILYQISPQKKINQHFIFSKFVLENVLINTGKSNNKNYNIIREETELNHRELCLDWAGYISLF